MKVLIVHNYTRGFATGGEANVFEDEAKLLESNGNKVQKLIVSNPESQDLTLLKRVRAFITSPWSDYGYTLVKDQLNNFKPDIVHVHNFFFVLSPKIFLACWEAKIPVVVTLHNYRLVVPCSQMLYKGKHCDICLGRNPWRILFKRCYKNSFFASLFRYRFYYLSQKRYNWWSYINKFIALNDTQMKLLITGGIDAQKIIVKQNFLEDHNPGDELRNGFGGLYVGRLSEEKGIKELILEWQKIDYPLKVIGAGPLSAELTSINLNPKVRFLGNIPRSQVLQEIKECAFVVVPSKCQETFGLVNIEAFSMGKLVLATKKGAMLHIIEDGINGLFFDLAREGDLKTKVSTVLEDQDLLKRMGLNARKEYLTRYTPQQNYVILRNIYLGVIESHQRN